MTERTSGPDNQHRIQSPLTRRLRTAKDQRARETGKSRAQRIKLNYLRGSTDGLERLRHTVTLAVFFLIVGALFVVVVAAVSDGNLTNDDSTFRYIRLSSAPGDLAGVHAAFDHACTSCHVSLPDMLRSGGLPSGHAPSDQKCSACHQGPPHHSNQHASAAPTCATCHQDHRGRESDLVRTADEHCVKCHQDLSEFTVNATNKEDHQLHITGFSLEDHPAFDAPADTGGIRFNHAVHLAPGIGSAAAPPLMKYSDIRDRDERLRYMQATGTENEASAVRLDCSSCHQLDRGDLGRKPDFWLPQRAAGAHFLPIVFENHCQACHPLDVPLQSEDLLPAASRAAGDRQTGDATIAVPHGLTPAEVRRYLTLEVIDDELRTEPSAAGAKRRLRIPGVYSETSLPDAQQLDHRVRAAERILFTSEQTCRRCHFYEKAGGATAADRIVERDEITAAVENNSLTVRHAQIPEIWYASASFDHAAHRALTCRACHDQASTSTTSSDVLLPDITNCVTCHAPAHTAGGRRVGGVRHGCTNCHRYHLVTEPLGAGAKVFEPMPTRSVNELLLN